MDVISAIPWLLSVLPSSANLVGSHFFASLNLSKLWFATEMHMRVVGAILAPRILLPFSAQRLMCFHCQNPELSLSLGCWSPKA